MPIGRGLGRLIYRLGRAPRHVTEVNLKLCFPERTVLERERLTREHFEALGIAVMETGLCWWASASRLAPLVELEGVEHLEAARATGRGVLLLSCHATCHELGARFLADNVGLDAAVYKPLKNPVIDYVSTRARSRLGRLVQRQKIRDAVRILSAGGTLWFAVDHAEGAKNSVLVRFFGEPKTMPTGVMRLAQISDARVVPFHIVRKPGGFSYRLIVRPPLADFPSSDRERDAERLIRFVEEQVELAPEQYSWAHRRFRKRRGMLPSPYQL
jgi:KDO2-lipid IV(A) lauroyltransferase